MPGLRSILIYGFALFAMFFGSGNLVFPIKIGQVTGPYWFLGFLGLVVTGILLPFCGLFVIKLHRGNYNSFFSEAGTIAKVALPLFTLSLLGSFGVVPRCITVAYGGMSYLVPQLSSLIFSALFCAITFFFCLKDQRMMNVLGKWMSPILLIALIVLIAVGVINANPIMPIENIEVSGAFYNGFITGYQTMDLFAAFFFSALMFTQIQKIMPETSTHKDTIKFAILPSILGAFLLAVIYLGFVFLGAHYAELTANVQPEFMLPTIAKYIMGNSATLLIGIAMLFSCLTTAVALNNIYARYLCTLFRLSDHQFPRVLFGTTAVAFLISLLDFKGIAAFLAPALEVSYPGIIALTMLGIITRKWRRFKMLAFYGISLVMVTMMSLSM
jgi:LIVCS family branched-chain amino acid:cation transporter